MEALEEEKVFKDPVHGYIYVHDRVIWDLINTREMQRLRRIRQLGTTYFAYPGGDHSRFSHSLGVYEVVRQIMRAFDRNGYDWPREHELLGLASGLLHDIGHAPFSHALEKTLGSRHERWSEAIIEDPSTEVYQVLERVRPGFAGEVSDVIGKRHPSRLIVSMVSGQLDADRLDYLMRDSIATGVDYGTFDLQRIIRVMRPYDGRIVVKESGLHTVEAYLLARYFMYWQVYFHPVSRSGEVVLGVILQRAQDILAGGGRLALPHPALEPFLLGHPSLNDYQAMDDATLYTAFSVWQEGEDEVLRDLSRRFLDRRLFAEVDWREGTEGDFKVVSEAVTRCGFDPHYYCKIDETGTVYYDYYLGGQKDQTSAETELTSGNEALWLYDKASDALTEMSRLSRPIQAIAPEPHQVRRLYVPREVLDSPGFGKLMHHIARREG